MLFDFADKLGDPGPIAIESRGFEETDIADGLVGFVSLRRGEWKKA